MTIRQSINLEASPQKIYSALLSSEQFSEFTGASAEISADEGGAFSCFGGQISGRHIQLQPNRQIVQAWRAGSWEEGIFSIVKFTIQESGNSSTLNMEQSSYPEGGKEHLEGGWHKMYWEPLKNYLSK